MKVESLWIGHLEIILRRKGLMRTAELAPECYAQLDSPEPLAACVRDAKVRADLLIFGQRYPDTVPHYSEAMVWQDLAILPLVDFDHWRDRQITKATRKNVGKAAKKGIEIREAVFDDEFVRGVMGIYDESPVRQGKPFLHYRKGFDTLKQELGTYPERSRYIGAYCQEELVGFIKLHFAGRCANTMQVISKLEHRDKKINNALMGSAVELCCRLGMSYLQYGVWSEGSLGDFKRYNGFEKMAAPLYYVPLTRIGRILIDLHLQEGLWPRLPERIRDPLLQLRKAWNNRRMESLG